MLVDIWSDQHQEFWRNQLQSFVKPRPGVSLLCAGDIGEQTNPGTFKAIKLLCDNYEHVYYVAGNHDYYHSQWSVTDLLLSNLDQQISNFHWVRTGTIHNLGDYRLIGDTGWIPKHPFLFKYPINDIHLIRECLPEAVDRHARWHDWAMNEADSKTIVMTHHLPSEKCVASIYAMEPTNRWFVGDCEDVILAKSPRAWIFGHTHMPFDFQLGNTRMVCNPLGYPGENRVRGPVEIEI